MHEPLGDAKRRYVPTDGDGQLGLPIQANIDLLDIGGEGRHPSAWNLNPSFHKTLGPLQGDPIPRHIAGRAEAMPLADNCVKCIVMERTPLRRAAVLEMLRVIVPGGKIVLRHCADGKFDPHAVAYELVLRPFDVSTICVGNQELQQSVVRIGAATDEVIQFTR